MAIANAQTAALKSDATRAQPNAARYRIAARSVALGMYVCDLDRPWLDTPFLIQGFVVEGDDEIAALARYCEWVDVDFDRSRPEVHQRIVELGTVIAAKLADTPSGAAAALARDESTAPPREPPDEAPRPAGRPDASDPHQARRTRADSNVRDGPRTPPAGRDAPPAETLWQRLRDAISGLFRRTASSRPPGPPEPPVAARQAAVNTPAPRVPKSLHAEIEGELPAGEKLTEWTDTRPIEEELPRAQLAMERGEKALATVFSDIRRGGIPQIESVREAMTHVAESMIENPDALLWVAHLRDKHTRSYRHAMRVALYMVAMGRQLGFPRKLLCHLGVIGLLADIGKTRVPQPLLDKPGLLTPAEFALVKEHVVLGLELLASSGQLPAEVIMGIEQHHERLDGSGYPNGLSASAIGIYGRMAAIADCFAAMTSARPYGEAVAPHKALMQLFEWTGRSFHAPLVEQFVQALGVFPVGSLIELTTGEVAVVLAHNRARRLEPRVLVLTDTQREMLPAPRELDLVGQARSEDVPPVRILRGLPTGAYGVKLADHYASPVAAPLAGPIAAHAVAPLVASIVSPATESSTELTD